MIAKRYRIPLFQLLIAALTVFGIARLYYNLTDDIRVSNMTYPMEYNPEWEGAPLLHEEQSRFDRVLNQQFSYIGKGAQSYAFVSEDGNYVLKFFKFKHLKPSIFVESLPDTFPFKGYRDTQIAKKKRKLMSVFNGYKLAYDCHRKESGLLYIHLNVQGSSLGKKVIVKDKIGLNRTIELDNVVFVLQECAMTSKEIIIGRLEEGNFEGAMAAIRDLLDLYRSEYAKGIVDHDHGVMHNTGFVGNRPIHLDVGKLYKEPEMALPENALDDITKVAVKIARKVQERTPAYHGRIVEALEAYISDAFEVPISLKERGAQVGFPL